MAVAAAVAAAPTAYALDGDVIGISVFATERYDSNLFRLPDDVQPFGSGRRSATIRSTGIGLQVDKTYGLQRFDLSGSITHDHYSPYESLDATGRAYNAAWGWTLTPSITGNLSVSRAESLNNFSDTLLQVQTQPNKRRTEERRFDVNWRPGAALHPRFAVSQNEDKSDIVTIDRQNAKTTSAEGALVYEFRSGNTAEVYFRRGRGNYLDLNADPLFQFDARFNERETGLSVHWANLSGASSLDGRLGYLDREHLTFASRNFTGPVGQLSYSYALSGKTSFQVSAGRSIYSAQSVTSSYARDQSVSIGATYSATGKITIRPSFSWTQRSFKGALVPVEDNLRLTMRDASLAVDYAALRWLSLSLAVGTSKRTANDRIYQFSDHNATASASVRF